MRFTETVRDELARVPCEQACCLRAELAAVLRLGGRLELRGGDGGVGWVVDTPSAALARRVHTALREVDPPTTIEVHRPGGLRRATLYRLRLREAGELLASLGLLDAHGRPRAHVPAALTRNACDAAAYLRGALMGAGSVSDPRRPPHLEITAGSEAAARHLERVARRCGAAGARATAHGGGWRTVVKGGAQVGTLLARAGAHAAFIAHDAERLRRELRAEANRAANADRANLGRAAGAAARQIRVIEALVAAGAMDDLEPDLRDLALARLANPEASLTELGSLLDPPVGKVTVHRRLERLAERAAAVAAG